MNGFRRHPDGTITAWVSGAEVDILNTLATELSTLMRHQPDGDPALLRLLPDAYPGDADASAEFRRYTQDGLTSHKIANAATVTDNLRGVTGDTVTIGPDDAVAWLTTLTDIRLTLAQRLGIVDEEQRSDNEAAQGLYDWLGFVQNAIIETLES